MAEQHVVAEELRYRVAALVEEDPDSIGDEENLFTLGLDSITLMQLVGRWRQAGVEVNFAEVAENPTIGAWVKLLAGRTPAVRPGTTTTSHASLPVSAEFPLAVMQHAYWIGRRDLERLGGVAAHLYTEFDGADVDPARLRGAIEQLVARHDMLRAYFTEDGRQRIEEVSGWRGLTVHDLRNLDESRISEQLRTIRDTLSHQILDIEHGEVFSTALSMLPEGRTRLHLDVDMVAADAVSYRILLADLAHFYEQPDRPLDDVGYSYHEYRMTHPEIRRPAARRAALWWHERLPDLPGAPDLPLATVPDAPPTDPLAEVPTGTGRIRVTRRYFMLPSSRYAALVEACRRQGLTPAMVLATAFAEVLGAWSASPRFLLNVPLFDREPIHPDVGRLVGDFSSSVLLEVDLTERVDFAERARRLQARMHTDTAYADYSGVAVLRELSRLNKQQVLAPVVFTSALSLGELFDTAVRRSFGDPVWIISQGPQVLLDTQVTELDGGLLVNWDVREQEFAEGVVNDMFAVFERLVHRIAEDDGVWTAPVDDLLPARQRAVRDWVNDTAGTCGGRATAGPCEGRLLHEGFFGTSQQHPGNVALVWSAGDTRAPRTLSYGELADRALRVAAALRSRGVRSGDPVAIRLPKGPDQIVAVLGVLAAGGAYVPVGMDQPPTRAERIGQVAGFRVAIVAEQDDQAIGPAIPLTLARALAFDPLDAPVLGPDDGPGYILFTSGSTGEPKGVEMPHRAATNTIDDLIDRFRLGPADRTLGVSALDFDLSVFDIFAPLSVGGAVVVLEEKDRRDARHWAHLIRQCGVTVLNCVPALLDMALSTRADLGDSLRLVLLGGDWVSTELPARLAAVAPGSRFVALGGTTETAIHSTICEVDARTVPGCWRSVPYGVPLRNVACRVVDHLGRDRPDWVPGELWIGGLGVAAGYRADPVRTAERFVVAGGRRWYRTGDLARYWPDGTLEFLGRTDFQVKIRGHRIELGEVEAALRAHEKVGHAVAVVVGEQARQLAAAVTATAPFAAPALDPDELRRWAADRLPAYMVPERVIVLDTAPITRNGKLDRREVHRRLAATATTHATFEPTRGPVEKAVAQIWSDLLGITRVGRTDNFFALGGDSLLATRVISQLRAVSVREDRLGMRQDITVVDLYRHPDLAALAAHLTAAGAKSGELDLVVARAHRQRSARQQRALEASRRDTNHHA